MTRGPGPGVEAPSGGSPEPADGEGRGADVHAGRAAPVLADGVAGEPADCYDVTLYGLREKVARAAASGVEVAPVSSRVDVSSVAEMPEATFFLCVPS